MLGWGECQNVRTLGNSRSPETPGKPTPAAPERGSCRNTPWAPVNASSDVCLVTSPLELEDDGSPLPLPSRLCASASPLLELCCQGKCSFQTSNLAAQNSLIFKKMFFSISKATENYQKRYLGCSGRKKRSVKNTGSFWSSLMSMWGKWKRVPSEWGIHAFPQIDPFHLPSCSSPLAFFALSDHPLLVSTHFNS